MKVPQQSGPTLAGGITNHGDFFRMYTSIPIMIKDIQDAMKIEATFPDTTKSKFIFCNFILLSMYRFYSSWNNTGVGNY